MDWEVCKYLFVQNYNSGFIGFIGEFITSNTLSAVYMC